MYQKRCVHCNFDNDKIIFYHNKTDGEEPLTIDDLDDIKNLEESINSDESLLNDRV